MTKKLISFILAILLAAAPLFGGAGTVRAASVSTDEMEALIEKQIRAFADSIDKSNADGAAAKALANHGMRGGGKTLKAGKTHALTATLFNSELLQSELITTCANAIWYMQTFDLESMPQITGACCWYGTDESYSQCKIMDGLGSKYENIVHFLSPYGLYSGPRNAYDNALDWMVANSGLRINIVRSKVTAKEATYKVTCTVDDRFDFRTGNGSGFKDLISGIGAVLFREFDWESTVSFNLTVPYHCTHSWGAYRWTYDSETKIMTSREDEGYIRNDAVHDTGTLSNGSDSHYYSLHETVRLYHNKPWVIEYDAKNPGNMIFGSTDSLTITNQFILRHFGRSGLFAVNTRYVTVSEEIKDRYDLYDGAQYGYNYCGTPTGRLFTYSSSKIYTHRLENKINSDGSNMIYLTISDTATGEVMLEDIPLDDHYYYESWIKEYVPVSKSSDWISGQDLYIQYFGQKTISFVPGYLDLRIWENGIEGGSGTYYKTKVTKPTCTAQGYTTYTCSCCGYSYKADKVKAKGHSFGDWTVVAAATCTENGEEQRKCKNCDHSENRTVEATGHNYENYVCTNCGDRKYVPGDVDLNETVDVDDVLALLWNVLFPEDYPIEVDADFDGNGTTDVDDVLTLLWHVLFPEEYPLN